MRIVAPGWIPDVEPRLPNPDDPRLGMTEKDLHAAVEQLATHLGWGHYHTYDSRHSKAGFPDLVLWRERVLFVELKSTKGTVRRDQDETLVSIAAAGAFVHLWRPVHWITGVVEHELRRR